MDESKSLRVFFAADTSGHTIGYHVVARALRDAGFEVIIAGRLLPDEAVKAAAEEGRRSARDPHHGPRPARVRDGAPRAHARANGIGDMPVLIGGIVAKRERREASRDGSRRRVPPRLEALRHRELRPRRVRPAA